MPTNKSAWTLVVHGGARSIPRHDRARFAAGCAQAAKVGGDILAQGGSAIDAVEAAVRVLEDLPDFNAGMGSVRNAAGNVEMDAAVMDGHTLAIGGVGAIREVRHPVSVARAMLDETPILLVGEGARQFATHIGAEPADAGSIPSSGGCDTVGCIARDQAGHVAAAGSTGGLEGKMVGRVGDTPLPGCGLYADDRAGATALSGEGESIARGMLAAHILFALPGNGALAAAQMAITRLERTGGEAGAIVLDCDGGFGIAHNSAQFSVAVAADWLDAPRAGTHADDLREWYT